MKKGQILKKAWAFAAAFCCAVTLFPQSVSAENETEQKEPVVETAEPTAEPETIVEETAAEEKNDGDAAPEPEKVVIEETTEPEVVSFEANNDAEPTGTLIEGTSVYWEIDAETHTLILSGNGAMPDYESPEDLPWNENAKDIQILYIGKGITHVSKVVFYGLPPRTDIVCEDDGHYTVFDSTETVPGKQGSSSIIINDGNIELCAPGMGIQVGLNDYNYSFVVIPAEGVNGISESAFPEDYGIDLVIYMGTKSSFEGKFNNNSVGENNDGFFDAGKFYQARQTDEELDKVIAEGPAGDNVRWQAKAITFIEDGPNETEVTFSGTGYISNPNNGLFSSEPLWVMIDNMVSVTSVVFGEGVIGITGNRFDSFSNKAVFHLSSTFTGGNEMDALADFLYNNLYVTEFEVDEDNQCFYSAEGVLFYVSEDSTILVRYPAGNERETYVMPDGVQRIAEWAFAGISDLKEIVISDDISGITEDAFSDCDSLEKIILPRELNFIDAYAFDADDDGKVIPTLYYPGTFTERERINIFTDVDSPILSKEDIAFSNCGDNLTWYFDENYRIVITGSGPMWNFEKETSESGGGDDPMPLRGSGSVITPVDQQTSFGSIAPWRLLYDNSKPVTGVVLDDEITRIGNYAFYNRDRMFYCETITIPLKAASIGIGAFANWNGIFEGFDVPAGNNSFEAVNGVLYSENTDTLIRYPNAANNEQYNVPDSVKYIAPYAFYWNVSDCDVTLPRSIEIIGESAFEKSGGLTVYYEGTEAEWNEIEIEQDQYINVNFKNLLKDFDCSFAGGELTISGFGAMPDYTSATEPWLIDPDFTITKEDVQTVKIEKGISSIGPNTFVDYPNLKTIYLPRYLNHIDSSAFTGTTVLSKVYYAGTPSEYRWEFDGNFAADIVTLTNCGDDITYTIDNHVLTISGNGEMWQDGFEWRGSTDITSIVLNPGENGMTISNDAFDSMKGLTSLTIPAGITQIGNNPVQNCTNLNEIIVADDNPYYCSIDGVLFTKDEYSRTLIAYPAGKFGYSYEVPFGVVTIGTEAFYNTTKFGKYGTYLTSITLPETLRTIEPYAFEIFDETGTAQNTLTKVIYKFQPEYWDQIEIWYGNGALTDALNNGLPEMPKCGENLTWSFNEKDKLLTVYGDDSSIWDFYYEDDEGNPVTRTPWDNIKGEVERIILMDGVTAVGMYAFNGFNNLKEVYIPSSVRGIFENAFINTNSNFKVIYAGTNKNNIRRIEEEGNGTLINATWEYQYHSIIFKNLEICNYHVDLSENLNGLYGAKTGTELVITIDSPKPGYVLKGNAVSTHIVGDTDLIVDFADYVGRAEGFDKLDTAIADMSKSISEANAFTLSGTQEEIEQYIDIIDLARAKGQNITIENAYELNEPTEEENTAISNAAGQSIVKETYDVKLGIKLSESENPIEISTTTDLVAITLPLSEDVSNEIEEGGTVQIIRVHDGRADVIDEKNSDGFVVNGDYVTFQTNMFSTYAIAVSKDKPKFTKHALLLSDEIGVQFRVFFPENFNSTDCYVDFVAEDGRHSTMTYAEAAEITGSNDRYFRFDINALELAENITATLHYGDGETATNSYSAMAYINAVQQDNGASEKLKNIVNALHAYGYYMQSSGWSDNFAKHTSIETPVTEMNASAIAEAAAEVRQYTVTKNYEAAAIADSKFSLTLNAQTVINVFVKPGDGATILTGGYKLREIGEETYYHYTTAKIGPRNLGEAYTVTVETDKGIAEITASAMAYVNGVLNGTYTDAKKQAMAAYYYYYQAAFNYEP